MVYLFGAGRLVSPCSCQSDARRNGRPDALVPIRVSFFSAEERSGTNYSPEGTGRAAVHFQKEDMNVKTNLLDAEWRCKILIIVDSHMLCGEKSSGEKGFDMSVPPAVLKESGGHHDSCQTEKFGKVKG